MSSKKRTPKSRIPALALAALTMAILATAALAATGGLWSPYSRDAVKKSLADGKPVMVYFHADWCGFCNRMSQYTLADGEVLKAMQGFTRLAVDLSANDSQAVRVAKAYGVRGLPTIVFLDGRGLPQAPYTVEGFRPVEQLLPVLKKAESTWSASHPN